MNKLCCALVVAAVASIFSPSPLMAQRISPHEVTSAHLGDMRLMTVVYGRPYTKDSNGNVRKIWGGLVPFDQVWRMGANEATILITGKTIEFGDLTVPAGAYTLFMQPNKDGTAKLIINKELGQMGAYTYDPEKNLGEVDLKKEDLEDSVDQFTMAIEMESQEAGKLKLTWEKTGYSIPFTVKK